MQLIDRAAVIGGGVIGAGWIARLIENGIDVMVYDPADDAEHKVEAVLKNSRHAYAKLTGAPRRSEGSITFCGSIAEAVAGAELIVESVPERLDINPTCRRRCNIPNACWWGIRSTRFTCCRWWNWSAARKPRPSLSSAPARFTTRWVCIRCT
jgi:glycine/D-amino acid oxidase-like deaminating enzyme